MTEGFPEQELREFIYLNDESINSHLSSLGVGLETTRVAASSEETELSGKFSAVVPTPIGVFGTSGGGKSTDSSETESQVDITVPYRFQELIRQINDEYEIKDPEEDDVEYGDVVAVEGVVAPLSFFRFEIAQDANLTLTNSVIAAELRMNKLIETLEEHDMTEEVAEIEDQQKEEGVEDMPVEVREARSSVNQTFQQISNAMTGDRVPVRLDSKSDFGGGSYGAVLDRTQLRVPETRAFSQPRKYTIFGRVENNIPASEEWDPIDTTRVMQSFASEDVGIAGIMEMIQSVAEENQIEMKDEHITIDGPAVIIDPLAVYW